MSETITNKKSFAEIPIEAKQLGELRLLRDAEAEWILRTHVGTYDQPKYISELRMNEIMAGQHGWKMLFDRTFNVRELHPSSDYKVRIIRFREILERIVLLEREHLDRWMKQK